MHVTRYDDAKPYPAQRHFGMTAFRLQGGDASPTENFWVGLSIFLPGGGAEKGSSPTEKVYIILEGELTIVTQAGETVLRALDSCRIEPNEERMIENRSNQVCRMLVVSPS